MLNSATIGLILSLILDGIQINNLVRQTESGLIKGALKSSRANTSVTYYAFTKVPYAQPPTGDLRFQEPLDPKSWTGIRDATEVTERCAQIADHLTGLVITGSEDCLYLDIYEPITAKEESSSLLPVMVWFHGGTFVFGEITSTGPDYLMEKPVIVVEVLYRLNVFGFLSTLDDNAKGNVGLKDQLYALKWVKKNIHNFGGDPNKVTIFGASAGGASVMYHMLSPKSKGYFHRAISESGSSLNRWAYQKKPREMVFRLSKGLGIKTNSTKDLVKQLQKVNYKTLLQAAFNKSIIGYYFPYYAQPFAPIIEKESKTAFLTKSMFELLSNGKYSKVPYMAGYNSEEGSFAYSSVASEIVDINIYEDYPKLLIPVSMNVKNCSDCGKKILERIIKFYFKNGNLTDKRDWIPYMSQELFIRGIVKTMNLVYKSLPMYFYRFSYLGSNKTSYLGGAQHYQETEYCWYAQGRGVESDSDALTRKRLVTLWTNFAATGNPTPKKDELLQNIIWPQMYPNQTYLEFGANLSLNVYPNLEDSVFWDKVFEECGNPPYVTY